MTDPSPIQKRLMLVGYICTEWAFVELLLARTIWKLIPVDEATGKIVTGGLDMLPRCRMALNLARERKLLKLAKALNAARDGLQDVIDDRNLAVHGHPSANVETGEVRIEAHRIPKHRTPRQFSIEWLDGIGAEIRSIKDALIPILVAHGIDVD